MQRCKEKGLSVGYCKGLYLVKNQFVTAKWCMWLVVLEFLKYRFLLDLKNMTPFHLAAKIGHFLLFNSFINKLSNGWFWLLNGVEWSQKFLEIYIPQLFTSQRWTNFRSHMKRSIVPSKTIKIALIPMIKTITASNLPQNPQKTKLADLKCTSGKWLFYIFRYAQLQNILQKIRFAHLAKFFASNSLRSFGKRSHFTGPILQLSLRSTFAKLF